MKLWARRSGKTTTLFRRPVAVARRHQRGLSAGGGDTRNEKRDQREMFHLLTLCPASVQENVLTQARTPSYT